MIEIDELRDALRKAFPADRLVPEREASWRLATDMGLLLTDLAEDLGGLGLGREALAIICFEQGRVLSAAPLLPALLALEGITGSPYLSDRADWIEIVCGGAYIPTNLLGGSILRGANGNISGQIAGVPDADLAEQIVASTSDLVFIIPLDGLGVSISERATWDRTRRLFDVTLDEVAIEDALILARAEAAESLRARMMAKAQLLLAADALGGAAAAFDMTIDFLKVRRQFDRPIAMFQAIKHRCADMKTILASAEALLWSHAREAEVGLVALGSLRAHAATVFETITEEMIQLHGGIGLTDEHPSHLFMKRAMLNLQLCGDIDHWRELAGRAALEQFTEV
jgi:alkylation response protein AidB-like acyl-CoA dehydrogenase